MKHFEHCDGDEIGYQWRWVCIQKRHKNYPVTPEREVSYPDILMETTRTRITSNGQRNAIL
jgi:hypothetical protein